MVKFVVLVWQSYYNMFLRVSKKIKEFEIKVYSARNLENDQKKLEEALREVKNSNLLLVYRSTQESFWEILEK